MKLKKIVLLDAYTITKVVDVGGNKLLRQIYLKYLILTFLEKRR
jgi:hypothetical protein